MCSARPGLLLMAPLELSPREGLDFTQKFARPPLDLSATSLSMTQKIEAHGHTSLL